MVFVVEGVEMLGPTGRPEQLQAAALVGLDGNRLIWDYIDSLKSDVQTRHWPCIEDHDITKLGEWLPRANTI